MELQVYNALFLQTVFSKFHGTAALLSALILFRNTTEQFWPNAPYVLPPAAVFTFVRCRQQVYAWV